jgi:sugar lactone lactonase YvrE
MRARHRFVLLGLLAAGGCGDDAPGADAGNNGPDAAAVIDGAPGIDAAPGPDGEAPIDGPASLCGTAQAPAADITGTEGIAIGADGSVYYSQSGSVGRWSALDSSQDDSWVALANAGTVWGMAINAEGILYVATPSGSGRRIFSIDTNAERPTAELVLQNAGGANGLTLGPDGFIYYSDFNGDEVYRVDPSNGDRTAVTDPEEDAINSPNGVLFDADGTLLVLSYGGGDVFRLTLEGGVETDRVRAGGIDGNPDGLARDLEGNYYVTDNSGGEVIRFDSDFANPEPILEDTPSAANMASAAAPSTATTSTSPPVAR